MIFFFKQKTAYEMRISDWSSDVCSSDLYLVGSHCDAAAMPHEIRLIAIGRDQNDPDHAARRRCDVLRIRVGFGQRKSEEHTSELQSLMRISYAVFCLKKKKQQRQ